VWAPSVNTYVHLGDTDEWVLINNDTMMHHFHIHQGDFQVISINDEPVDFYGYQDTVPLPAMADGMNSEVRIRVPFTKATQLGRYVYHCHIMSHEDLGMMAVIQVNPVCPQGQFANNDSVCQPCAQVRNATYLASANGPQR
jgi:suppressor of ftsI